VKGARVYDHYRDLLADPEVDAVLIAVPIEVNHSVLIDAMRSGKHVLAEKPLAATPEQGLAVLDTPAPNSVVAIAENFRYRRDLAKAREILAQGLIGEVFAFQLSVKFHLDAEGPARLDRKAMEKRSEISGRVSYSMPACIPFPF